MDAVTKYTVIFYLVCIFPWLGFVILAYRKSEKFESFFLKIFSFLFVFSVTMLIGFRPIGDNGFQDTPMYISWFEGSDFPSLSAKDYLFSLYIYLCSFLMSVRGFFIITSVLSFVLLYFISRKVSKEQWFLFAMSVMVSLYFWNQQVFTIRQGMASLFFMLALVEKRKTLQIILCILSVGFHYSFAIVALIYVITIFIQNTKFYIFSWISAVIISLILFNLNTDFLQNLMKNTRLEVYWQPGNNLAVSENYFRWDVVIYSAIFLGIGCFNISKIKDAVYQNIVNLYIGVNVIVMVLMPFVGGFIHRFAYLSWFMIPLIIFYPLLKTEKVNLKKFVLYFTLFYGSVTGYVGYKIITQDGHFVKQETAI